MNMPLDIRDWCALHYGIFTEVSEAILEVDVAMTRATQVAGASGLEAPQTRSALSKIVVAARALHAVVDRALGLPPIPEGRSDAQFRHAMHLRGKWATAIADAAGRADADALSQAAALGLEATKAGADIERELRQAWPLDGAL